MRAPSPSVRFALKIEFRQQDIDNKRQARIAGKVFPGDAPRALVAALGLPATTLRHGEQSVLQRHMQVTVVRATECVLCTSLGGEVADEVESCRLVVRDEEEQVVIG